MQAPLALGERQEIVSLSLRERVGVRAPFLAKRQVARPHLRPLSRRERGEMQAPLAFVFRSVHR